MKHARDRGAYVLQFFLCFFVLLSSGRIASSDAGHQLQASVMFALTGRLGDDGRSGGPSNDAWVRAPNGRLYQAHDIGNIVLMLPAAWVGSWLSPAPPAEDIRNPPALSRVGMSLTGAFVASLGCYWLFRLFALVWSERAAFLLALAFPTTTIFIAYARAAWDVMPAAALMCGVLSYSALLLRGERPTRSAAMVALTLGAACSFRFSLGPFILPAACGVFAAARRWLSVRSLVISAAIFLAVMLPSLTYNNIRTGSPLRPATASAQYLEGNNALTGSIPSGLAGLLVSPNRGLFASSPILLFALAMPFLWRRLPSDQRTLLIWYGGGAFAYTLLIAKMANWGAFGWGPRYLIPVLPVVFLAAAAGIRYLFDPLKPLVMTAIGVCAVLSLPPAIVNWHLATTTFHGAADPHASWPYQQIAGWRALAWGIAGKPLPVSADAANDAWRPAAGMFPDLLLARLSAHSRAGVLVTIFVSIAGVAIAGSCASRLIGSHEGEPATAALSARNYQ
jgi:hypothetical protein